MSNGHIFEAHLKNRYALRRYILLAQILTSDKPVIVVAKEDDPDVQWVKQQLAEIKKKDSQ